MFKIGKGDNFNIDIEELKKIDVEALSNFSSELNVIKEQTKISGESVSKLNKNVLTYEIIEISSQNLSLDLSKSSNFVIQTVGNVNSLNISFTNPPQITKEMTSLTIMLNYMDYTNITFSGNVIWRNDEKPSYSIGKTYLLLFQSFDGGQHWLSSAVGEWQLRNLISVFDDFQRPNTTNTLGSTVTGQVWEYNDAIWKIESNSARTTKVSGFSLAYVESRLSNCYISSRFNGNFTSQNRIILRLKDNENYIAGGWDDKGFLIVRGYTNGVGADIYRRNDVSIKVGDVLSFKVKDALFEVFINGVKVGQFNSTLNFNATKHGIWLFGNQGYFTDFEVREL